MSKKNKCLKCGKDTLLSTCATCLKTEGNPPKHEKKIKLIKNKKVKKDAEIKEDFQKKKSNSNIYSNMLKSKSQKLKFTERVNVDRAKKLLSMSNKDIIENVYDENETDEDGSKRKVDDHYVKTLKRYLSKVIANDGLIEQTYKYSKPLTKEKQGRIYVNGMGIQYLQKKLRGYLGGEYTKDVDMVNCFPTLMVWLCENYYPSINITDLKKYVNKREKLLTKYKTTKIEILAWANRDFKYSGGNVLIKCLDNVFKDIQSALWTDTQNPIVKMIDRSQIKSTNKKGSVLGRVLGIIENDILQQVIQKFKDMISVPYYDGCWVNSEFIQNEEEFINELNEFTKDYKVKWSIKDHETLNIPELEEEELNSDDDDDLTLEAEDEFQLYYDYIEYAELKEKFEKTHSVIASPLMVCREYLDKYYYNGKMKEQKKYELYSFSNIRELYMNLFYKKKEMKYDRETGEYYEVINDVQFIKDWLYDATRKTLSKMDFCPHNPNRPEIAPNNIYNMFDGYRAKLPNPDLEYDFDVDAEVQRFLNHLNLIVGKEEDAYNYLINYIADLVQNPQNLPSVALVFKSKQGLGKDLFVNYIEKMLGDKYIYRTSNLEEVYGNFNPAVKGKLLVQLNEVEGKDGFAKKERLKDSITAETLNINEKNIKQFKIRNAIRFIIFSNNLTPLDIPADDRRYVIFQGADLLEEKDREDYYNPLFDNLNNELIMNKILEYFMNIDLTDFNLRRHRPITKAYKDIRESCIPPLYKFSWDWLNKLFKAEEYTSKMLKHKKLEGKRLIKSTDFHKLYQSWYEKVLKAETTLNFKTIKPMLENIDIKKKEVRISGYKDYYYIIDCEASITKLRDEQKCGVEEEDILELDDEDFEEYLMSDDEE